MNPNSIVLRINPKLEPNPQTDRKPNQTSPKQTRSPPSTHRVWIGRRPPSGCSEESADPGGGAGKEDHRQGQGRHLRGGFSGHFTADTVYVIFQLLVGFRRNLSLLEISLFFGSDSHPLYAPAPFCGFSSSSGNWVPSNRSKGRIFGGESIGVSWGRHGSLAAGSFKEEAEVEPVLKRDEFRRGLLPWNEMRYKQLQKLGCVYFLKPAIHPNGYV